MNTSSKNIILGLAVVGIILVSLFMLTRSDRRVVLSISGKHHTWFGGCGYHPGEFVYADEE